MSCRRATSGFTLLELQVGLLLLTLVVVGFTRLVRAQEQLVVGLEDWCKDEPVYRIVPPEDPHERVVGLPAALEPMKRERLSAFVSLDTTPRAERYVNQLEIQSIERTLVPPSAKAVVLVKGTGK